MMCARKLCSSNHKNWAFIAFICIYLDQNKTRKKEHIVETDLLIGNWKIL